MIRIKFPIFPLIEITDIFETVILNVIDGEKERILVNSAEVLHFQLDHRILATATLVSIGSLWWATRKLDIHPAIRSLIGSTMGMAALQVLLIF